MCESNNARLFLEGQILQCDEYPLEIKKFSGRDTGRYLYLYSHLYLYWSGCFHLNSGHWTSNLMVLMVVRAEFSIMHTINWSWHSTFYDPSIHFHGNGFDIEISLLFSFQFIKNYCRAMTGKDFTEYIRKYSVPSRNSNSECPDEWVLHGQDRQLYFPASSLAARV